MTAPTQLSLVRNPIGVEVLAEVKIEFRRFRYISTLCLASLAFSSIKARRVA